MSPPERGSRWSGRRRQRSHKRHQQPAAHPHGAHAASFRENRRRERRQMMRRRHEQPPEPPLVCPTWVFIPFANVHVARDRAWFKDDYVPYRTQYTNSQGEELEAIGIGTVAITIEWPDDHRTEVTLKNVLHSPDAVCNIIGYPITEDYYIDPIEVPWDIWRLRHYRGRGGDGSPIARFRQEGNGARLTFSELPRDTTPGPHGLLSGKVPAVYWPEIERDRFLESHGDFVDDLCASERAWLKEHWGDEFRFLLEHQLNVYDKDERHEGRIIMGVAMAEESIQRRKRQEGGHENSIAGCQQHVPKELGDVYNTLLANRHFSDAEREWINGRYGDLKTFLDWFRYKLYEPDENKEAKKHLQWLIWVEGKSKEAPAFLGMR